MSQKLGLHCKRKQIIGVKLDQLKIESDIAISCIKKIFDKGRTLVTELDGVDHTTFLQRYPQVNKELDRLVNNVIQLNCCLELPSSSEDETEETVQLQINPPCEIAATVLPVIVNNVSKELPAPLIRTCSFDHLTIPCNIQEGDILDMCYLHGDNPFNFWLRHYSTKALEEVTEVLMCRFNGGCLRSCENPCVGMYVCVCYGQQFYRAKVLQILKIQPVEVLVLNVDNGETKEAKIENIYHLDEDISSLDVQCINCNLQENLVDDHLWNDTVGKIFAQILRDSNLVVTVTAKLPGEESRFTVEVDCHNEGRIVSKIELSKWLTSEVYPLLHQIEQNSLAAETLMVLNRCLDLVHTEETQSQPQYDLTSDVNSFHQSSTFVTDGMINEAAGGRVDERTAISETIVEFYQNKPLFRSKSTCEISSKNVALRFKRLSFDYHDTGKSIADNQKNEHNDLQVYDPGPPVYMPCKFNLFQRALDSLYGQSYDAMIAHIENPGHFYIHIVCAENTQIDNLGYQMNNFYEKSKIHLKTKCEAKELMGSFCAAYHDNYKGWYRGQVTDWNEEDEKLIRVKFVDYGDEQSIPLEAIQPLRLEFTEFPIFSQCCHLANIHPVNSLPEKLLKIWSIESINLFKCLVDMNTLYSVVIAEDGQNANSLSVLLCDNPNEICINKSMVDYGYAINFLPFEGPLDLGFEGRVRGISESEQKDVSLQNEFVPVSHVQKRTGGKFDSRSIENKHTDFVPLSETVAMMPVPLANREVENLDYWDPMSEHFFSETNNLYHDDEDATYIVTGYKPQDEKRICKLFATTGKCFKGSTCVKEHSFIHKDGWTTDKEKVYREAFSMLILPREGSDITLEITEIVNANTFWAIIRDDTTNEAESKGCNGSEDEDHQEETLLTLNDYLNQNHNVKSLKKLEISPALGQIVVAKYADGRYYRARVVDHGENNVAVVYVDYGNKEWVSLSNIRGIEQKYLHLPFQAVECILANVERISNDLEGARLFHNLLQGVRVVHAKVVNSYDQAVRMEVVVMNNDGHDLGSKIIERGLGKVTTYGTVCANVQFLNG